MEVKDTNKIITITPEPCKARGGVISFNERTGEVKASLELKGNADGATTITLGITGSIKYVNSSGATVTDNLAKTFASSSYGSSEWKRYEVVYTPALNTSTGGSNNCIPMADYGEASINLTTVNCGGYSTIYKANLDLNPVKHKVTMLSEDSENDTTPVYKFTLDDLGEIQSLYPTVTTSVSTEVTTTVTTDAGSTVLGGNRVIFVNGRKLDATNRTPMTGTNPVTFMSEIKNFTITTQAGGTLPLGDNNYTLNLHCEDI